MLTLLFQRPRRVLFVPPGGNAYDAETWLYTPSYPNGSYYGVTANRTLGSSITTATANPAGCYYVGPAGSNSNTALQAQTQATAWLTLRYAADNAPTNATICILAGTYREGGYTATKGTSTGTIQVTGKRLTIRAAQNAVVILDGCDDFSASTWNTDTTEFTPTTYRLDSFTPNLKWTKAKRQPHEASGNLVFLDGVQQTELFDQTAGTADEPLEDAEYLVANMAAGYFYVDQTANQLWLGTNPAGKTVLIATREALFSIENGGAQGAEETAVNGTILEGVNVIAYGSQLQQAAINVDSVQDFVLRACRSVFNASSGISLSAKSTHQHAYEPDGAGATATNEPDRELSADGLFEDNVLTWNGQLGLHMAYCNRTIVRNNAIAWNNKHKAVASGFEAGANKLSLTNDAVFHGNHCHDNDGNGLWSDVQCRSTIYRYNRCARNKNGISFELSGTIAARPAYFLSNLCYDNELTGIWIHESNGAIIVNNTCYRNQRNIRYTESSQNTDRVRGDTQGTADGSVQNNEQYNNLLGATNLPDSTSRLWFTSDNRGSGTRILGDAMVDYADYDGFWKENNATPATAVAWQVDTGATATENSATLPIFTAAHPQYEANALWSVVATDPWHVDSTPGVDDYTPAPGSTALAAGLDLSTAIMTLLGEAAVTLTGVPMGLLHTPLVPAVLTTYASDVFARTSTNAWDSADVGGAYTLTGATSGYGVSGGLGRHLAVAAGGNRRSVLASVSALDVDITCKVQTDKLAVGGRQTAQLAARYIDANNCYRLLVQFETSGAVILQMAKLVANVQSNIGSSVTVSGLTHVAATPIRVRFQATTSGGVTTVKASAWADGGSQPGTWSLGETVAVTDSEATLQVVGGVGVRSLLNGSASNAPVEWAYDDYLVTSV